MDAYKIKGDNGVSSRKNLVVKMMKDPYIDGATDYCLLVPFVEEGDFDNDQKLWLSFLYGLTYSCTTSLRIFSRFPVFKDINLKELNEFWEEERDTLWFNPDRKYIKNNNQFVPSVKSFRKALGGRPYQGLIKSLGEDYNFEDIYKHMLKNWKYFGPHGSYLFFDALYGIMPEAYRDPTNLDWKNGGATVVEGMSHFLYLDEVIEPKDYNYTLYNHNVELIQRKLGGIPKVQIESTLCAFRKFFKGTRYLGYYADRMLEECIYVDSLNVMPEGIDIWELREKTIPANMRGETQGWTGIRKERCKLWLNDGVIFDE